MKIILNKRILDLNADRFLRENGYAFIVDRARDKESYVRRLGNHHYPRLHMYFKEDSDKITFDLHLDQKQASYEGSHMHNAEYEGDIVENEIARLKSSLRAQAGR